MFVETALRNTRRGGYAAQITPGGLYAGANASAIRHHLLDECRLDTILGYDNYKKAWFDVDMARFSSYTARTGGQTEVFEARFGLANTSDLSRDPVRVRADLIRKQSPDTYVIPDLRNPVEMAVAEKLVSAYPAFGDPAFGPVLRHYHREIDMGNDKSLFSSDETGLPLYEGRMVEHFDHRAKGYVSGHGNSAVWSELPFGSPEKAIVPQWYIPIRDVPKKLGGCCYRYRIGFCDIASPRDRRSFVAALIPPRTICGQPVPTITYPKEQEWAYLPWLAVANSTVMDWFVRSRLASTHMTFSIVDRLPFPRFLIEDERVSLVASLVLRLTCTAPEMTDYWNSMAVHGWCRCGAVGFSS